VIRAVLLLSVLFAAHAPPPARVVTGGSTHHAWVALTFDAGADRGYAPRILRTLERNHIHASFGMTGRWAQANPDLVRRMARDGDLFINHTYDHQSFTGLSSQRPPLTMAQRRSEIVRADSIIHRLTGRSSKPFFRPPYGDYDAATRTLVSGLGYRYMVMWSVDSQGWNGLAAPGIVQRCLALTAPGGIILMHVGIQSQDGFALPAVISGLRHRGYHFVTVRQLLGVH
jgi:peptidoglycan-N-acetylglucosamine deacetylase